MQRQAGCSVPVIQLMSTGYSMLKFPVHTLNLRTSRMVVTFAPAKNGGVGRSESVPISKNSPSIDIGAPNRPKRVSSAPYFSRPYLNPNTCNQLPVPGADGKSNP